MGRFMKVAFWAWLGWRLFGGEIPPRFAPGQEHPLRLTGHTVFAGDREMFVREAGPPGAPPVVLLHGLGGESLLEWYKVVPLLAGRFRVVVVDLRNHGKSVKPRRAFEMADMADDVAACLDGLGMGRAAVVGYSMGGMVAQELAHRHPAKVDALVLVATAAFHPPHRRIPRLLVGVLLARGLERLTGLEVSRVRHHYLQRTGAVDRRHARWFWDTTLDRDANLYFQSELALFRFDARDWIGRLGQPSLVIIPANDFLVPAAWQRDLAGRIPGAGVVEIPGAGHELPWSHPEELAGAIEHFVARRVDSPGVQP